MSATITAKTEAHRRQANGRFDAARERSSDVVRERSLDVDRKRSPDVVRVGGDIGELVDDISTLVDLQTQLLKIDVQSMIQRAIAPLMLCILGAVLLIAAIPVVLMGLGWLLVEQAGWSVGASLLSVAGVALVLAIALAGIGGLLLKNVSSALDRSRAELAENIRWIKAAFNRRRIRERKAT